MTLTELTSVASVIAVVGGGTLWLETRYVKLDDLNSIRDRLDALESSIEAGHQRAKFEAILEGKRDDLADMLSREMMYRALDQAEVITQDQRNRWADLSRSIDDKRDEVQTYETALRSLL